MKITVSIATTTPKNLKLRGRRIFGSVIAEKMIDCFKELFLDYVIVGKIIFQKQTKDLEVHTNKAIQDLIEVGRHRIN
jgi:hypothetical protein